MLGPSWNPPRLALPAGTPTSAASTAGEGREVPSSPVLSWPGRRWVPRVGHEPHPAAGPGICLEQIEYAGSGTGSSDASSPPRLLHGDAMDVAGALAAEGLSGSVDLVYLDPPFASQVAYEHEARLDGPADGRVVRTRAYDDRWGEGVGDYLDMLAPRLEAVARLLSPTGTVWVHVDWRASYLVRLLLDEILGRNAFVNEIVWRRAPNLGRQAASHQFGRTLDTIVVYGGPRFRLALPTRLEPIDPAAVRWDEAGRPFTSAPRGDYTDESIARLEKLDRVHRSASGRVYIKYFLVKNADGAWCRERRVDALWTDVPPLRHARASERTGFPTQKPRALLDRIVTCASPPGGLVVDLFAGSGTTGESAHALGRRVILGDASPLAIATARARLLRAGAALTLERCGVPATTGAEPSLAGDPPTVHVAREGKRWRVRLEDPSEPLAWAVDPEHEPSHPFRSVWHSERAPGVRPRPAERVAVVDRVDRGDRDGRRLAVRVWYDDGRVGTRLVEVP